MNDCCTDHDNKAKAKYPTLQDAKEAARVRREAGEKIKIYACDKGGGYHLTSHGHGDQSEEEQNRLVRRYSKRRIRSVNGRIEGQIDEVTRDALEKLKETAPKYRRKR